MLINNVQCDTYVHVDAKIAGETVLRYASGTDFTITAYLFVNRYPFPLGGSYSAECYIREESQDPFSGAVTAQAQVGDNGEVVIQIPSTLRTAGNNLLCEINIVGTDRVGRPFRYKATNFRVAIV